MSATLHLLLVRALTKTKLQNFFKRKTCDYLIMFHEEENLSADRQVASASSVIMANCVSEIRVGCLTIKKIGKDKQVLAYRFFKMWYF